MPFVGPEAEQEEFQTSEQILYQSAQDSLATGNYNFGAEKLQRLEARFPFGRYAEQAQLELIYAYYMSNTHDSAQSAADRFIRLHPQHPSVDYAYYMRGLTAYSGSRGMFERIFPSDQSMRDVTDARQAFVDFSEFLNRFPDSDYAKDAYHRMVYLRNLLAESEIDVASYYMTRDAWVAASNRAREVIENYSTTPSVPDALAILVECNYRLGLPDSANDALRVLAINYPDYRGFDDEGNLILEDAIKNRDRSWVNLMTFGLIDRPDVPPPIEIRHPEGFTPPVLPRETADEAPPSKPWYRRIFG